MHVGKVKFTNLLRLVFLTAAIFFIFTSSADAAIIYSNSVTGDDSTGDGSQNSPYKTFHKAYTAASSGDTINLTGTFTWTDAGETGDSSTSASGYTISKNLTITGQTATSTIIQAHSASSTADRRVFSVGGSATVHSKI